METFFVCAKCGAKWPSTLMNEWGKSAETLSYGSTPVCPNMVEDRLGSNAVCGGMLAAVVAERVPDDVRTLTRL